MDRRVDLAVALAFAALGLLMIWQATLIKSGLMRDPVGPRAAFYLCGGVLVVGGLLVALRRWRELGRGEGREAPHEGVADERGYPASAPRAFMLMGCCLAYAALFQPLGYLLATPLFVVAALLVLGQRNGPGIALTALAFTAIVYLVFAQALDVRLPVGPLTGPFRRMGWITL